jgi:transcriptional regulator with XRE-family HTH domain
MIDPQNNRLAELMESKGVSRPQLAALLDRTEDTIRRLEENRGGPIPSHFIPTLAALFEVTPEYLMGWDRDSAPKAAV